MSEAKYGINAVIKNNDIDQSNNIDFLLNELTTHLAESQEISISVRNGRFIRGALKAISPKKNHKINKI